MPPGMAGHIGPAELPLDPKNDLFMQEFSLSGLSCSITDALDLYKLFPVADRKTLRFSQPFLGLLFDSADICQFP